MATTTDLAHIQIHRGETLGFRSASPAYHAEFAGAGDMVRAAAIGAARPELLDCSFMYGDPSWIGRDFKNFDDVISAVDGIWPEGIDRVEEMSRELEREELPRPTVIKRRRQWDEFQGDEIDVDRYRAADPYFRTNSRVRQIGPRVITLLVQLNQRGGMSPEDLFWRGALAVTLARIVEDAGYRTEIVALTMSRGTIETGPCRDLLSSVRLKEAGDSLAVSSLVNVTSSWFYRTVEFASRTIFGEKVSSGLGYPVEANEIMSHYLAPGAKAWLVSGVYSKDAALDLARTYLKTLVLENQ